MLDVVIRSSDEEKNSAMNNTYSSSTTSSSHHHNHNLVNGDIDIRWRELRSGRFKCNVDASFSTTSNKVRLGMCIRDSEGNHVCSKTMWFTPLCYVDIGRVADYFNKGRGHVTKFGYIMDSCIQFCSTYLTNSHVEFIRRQANEVAHELAKTTTSSSRQLLRIFLGQARTLFKIMCDFLVHRS
ncbi:hypothetical protein MTR_7g006380 [Medicago truncatula]|uniref:RNase H type-1 domain-containing protein n=1 Tax=Medicago truncatula TaxID=3880 RepID=G7KXP6_MEDTR|nr:hypothetical protein MTR_7g006380 [Medicago truncatula]